MLARSRLGGSYAVAMRPVFIGGCHRSGTTMLGAMLGVPPASLCVPEMPSKFGMLRLWERRGGAADPGAVLTQIARGWRFQMWGVEIDRAAVEDAAIASPRELVEYLVKSYGRKLGRSDADVWIEHSPRNVQCAATLFALFPEARMVHIVRDGRGVAASIMPLDWGPNEIEGAGHFWAEKVGYGLGAESALGPERVVRVRYEDLVLDPEKTLQALCPALGLAYDPAMVEGSGFRPHRYSARQHALVGHRPEPARVDAWERELTPRQVEIFEHVTGDLLCYLGYVPRYGARARRMSRGERLTMRVRELAKGLVNQVRVRRRTWRAKAGADGDGDREG